MKRRIIMGLTAAMLAMSLGVTGAMAHGPHHSSSHHSSSQQRYQICADADGACVRCVDRNWDGVCDTCCTQLWFVDQNGDGVCDYCAADTHHSSCNHSTGWHQSGCRNGVQYSTRCRH